MLEPLTDLERGILEYLIEYLRQHTYQPSIREIGRRFNIKSTKTVSEHLQALAEKGWIERDPARSRGIRVLGLELDVDTVAVPLHDAANPGPDLPAPDAFAAPCRQLLLDRSLVGTTRAAFLPMPDDALSDAGIHRGDLLLVEPVAAEDLEPGDIVVTNLAGQTAVLPWAELQGEPALTPTPLGRVNAIFRRLRIPPALVAAHGDADIDAGTHAN